MKQKIIIKVFLKKLSSDNIEEYMQYLSYYIKDGKEGNLLIVKNTPKIDK